MRRVLFDTDGVLRPVVVVLLVALVAALVLVLATWGGWGAMVGIGLILTACLLAMIRLGQHRGHPQNILMRSA